MPATMTKWRGFSGRPQKFAKAVTSWHPIFTHVKCIPVLKSVFSVQSNGFLSFEWLGFILPSEKRTPHGQIVKTSLGAMNGYSHEWIQPGKFSRFVCSVLKTMTTVIMISLAFISSMRGLNPPFIMSTSSYCSSQGDLLLPWSPSEDYSG